MFYRKDQRTILEMLFPEAGKYHALLESIGNFAQKEILPDARKIDRDEIFPQENLAKVRRQGIMALPFPRDYDGSGLPFCLYVAALEMLAKACANTALQVSIQGMICEGIRLFGDDLQRKTFLKENGLVEGRSLAAFALTEPCCGSDAKSLQTKAELSGNTFLLNGNKTLITNAREADYILTFARSERGISSFLVPRNTPGLRVMQVMPKLGFRGNSLSSMHLENCCVAADTLIGEEGKGLEYAKQILNAGRMTIAAIAVGIAQAAYDKSLSYSRERKAFGESIEKFELVREKLADMATGIQAARLLTYYAARLKDKGGDVSSAVAQAKLFASETALRVCDAAIQIHGGYGYVDAYDVHRHWRDARLLTIGEGTSDMLRLLTASLSLKEDI